MSYVLASTDEYWDTENFQFGWRYLGNGLFESEGTMTYNFNELSSSPFASYSGLFTFLGIELTYSLGEDLNNNTSIEKFSFRTNFNRYSPEFSVTAGIANVIRWEYDNPEIGEHVTHITTPFPHPDQFTSPPTISNIKMIGTGASGIGDDYWTSKINGIEEHLVVSTIPSIASSEPVYLADSLDNYIVDKDSNFIYEKS